VLQEVVWEVRNKLRGKGKFKKNNVNVEICNFEEFFFFGLEAIAFWLKRSKLRRIIH